MRKLREWKRAVCRVCSSVLYTIWVDGHVRSTRWAIYGCQPQDHEVIQNSLNPWCIVADRLSLGPCQFIVASSAAAVVCDATLLQPKPFCDPPAPTGCPSMVAVMALTLPIPVVYSALHVFVKIPLSIFLKFLYCENGVWKICKGKEDEGSPETRFGRRRATRN